MLSAAGLETLVPSIMVLSFMMRVSGLETLEMRFEFGDSFIWSVSGLETLEMKLNSGVKLHVERLRALSTGA